MKTIEQKKARVVTTIHNFLCDIEARVGKNNEEIVLYFIDNKISFAKMDIFKRLILYVYEIEYALVDDKDLNERFVESLELKLVETCAKIVSIIRNEDYSW